MGLGTMSDLTETLDDIAKVLSDTASAENAMSRFGPAVDSEYRRGRSSAFKDAAIAVRTIVRALEQE